MWLVRPKAKWVRVLYLVGVGVVLFVLFDRGVFFLLRETAFGFYRSSQPEKDWYGQSSWFKKNYFNTLILGTSRTKEGIHPLYLYKQLGLRAYNAASPGRYARFNYLFYREFKRQNGKPKIVIYGIDYFLFSKTSSPGQLQQLRGEGKDAVKRIDYRRTANKGSPLFSRISLLFRTKPHLDQYFADAVDYLSMALENRQNRDILPAGISTYVGLYGTVKDQVNRSSPNREKAVYKAFPGKEGDYFNRLLEELRKDRVRVFLVVLPDFYPVYETNFEHEKFHRDIRKIARRYANVVYVNYNAPDQFDLYNPAYFADGEYGNRISHLSVYGSKILSLKLCRAIQRYFERRQESWF